MSCIFGRAWFCTAFEAEKKGVLISCMCWVLKNWSCQVVFIRRCQRVGYVDWLYTMVKLSSIDCSIVWCFWPIVCFCMYLKRVFCRISAQCVL